MREGRWLRRTVGVGALAVYLLAAYLVLSLVFGAGAEWAVGLTFGVGFSALLLTGIVLGYRTPG
jgi:hypothetical protein